MLKFYKTIDNRISEIGAFEEGCWIDMINPTEGELLKVHNDYGIDYEFLKAPLDVEETSRIESEEEQTLLVVDVPTTENHGDKIIFETLPLAVITGENCIVTVCTKETSVISGFSEGIVKNVNTKLKTRFILQILYRVSTRYLFYLKQIDRMSNNIEKELHISLKNKELIQLLDLEKSLVFFSTSLKANETTIERLQRGRFVKLYEEDEDLIEDVLIEMKQAIEMTNIYSSILSGTMDAFASVISNNQNIVMKRLTSITILMAVPTMIYSFYGMNVVDLPIPFSWFPFVLSLSITVITWFILNKKDML